MRVELDENTEKRVRYAELGEGTVFEIDNGNRYLKIRDKSVDSPDCIEKFKDLHLQSGQLVDSYKYLDKVKVIIENATLTISSN